MQEVLKQELQGEVNLQTFNTLRITEQLVEMATLKEKIEIPKNSKL